MDLIIGRSNVFKKLVINDFLKSCNLKNTSSVYNLFKQSIGRNLIYCKKNYMLIHNSILNSKYKKEYNLSNDKYSIIFILYKNISYIKKNGKCIARLDSECKKKIKNVLKKYAKESTYIDQDIIIIGRKYINIKNSNEKNNNCLSMYCTYNISKLKVLGTNHNQKLIKFTPETDIDNDSNEINSDSNDINDDSNNIDKKDDLKNKIKDVYFKSVLRRKFWNNLQNMILEDINIRYILDYSIFFDTEFTNDIYDDFKNFPISQDLSVLFMIGTNWKNTYETFIVNSLTQEQEKQMIEKFLISIDKKRLGKNFIFLFHWSNADKYIIDKTLSRYPDLSLQYKETLNSIKYIDLMKLVKETLTGLSSYSLKYISKYLFNIEYDTDCKNGFDAMCYIIEINNLLYKKTEKNLSDFDTTKDIIQYNRMDTDLLYKIFTFFFK